MNEWLQNPDQIDFHDKKYLKEVCGVIRKFIFKCPVPLIAEWKDIDRSILFSVGQRGVSVAVNPDVAPFDMITLIENGIKHLYPHYKVLGIEKEVGYSVEEIAKMVKEGTVDFDDAFNLKKRVREKEEGHITRAWFLEDRFRINIQVNDEEPMDYVCLALIPVSEFLKSIRSLAKISTAEEIKAFIEKNSKILYEERNKSPIHINYTGKQLLNFFLINADWIKKPLYWLHKIDQGNVYRWGNFVVLVGEDQEDGGVGKIIESMLIKDIDNYDVMASD